MEFHHHHEHDEEEEEGEMALPISSTYGHNHNHNHILPLSLQPPSLTDVSTITVPPPPPPPSASSMEDISKKMVMVQVRYRECLKNHAASIGGKATDGCGEFMASGEEGTLEALTCSVCNCHRNFHRKEMEGGDHMYNHHPHLHHPIPTTSYDYINYHSAPAPLKRFDLGNGRNFILQHHHPKIGNGGALVPMGYNMGMGGFRSESDQEQEDPRGGAAAAQQVVKKRFRTKFTQEQKEKMVKFAEKVGWKIQRQEESVVQHFCQEIGIKRRVLKVWMHNNKQNLAKNTNSISINPPQSQSQHPN